MNTLSVADLKERLAHRVRLRTRVLDPNRRVSVFSERGEVDSLGRIYVINLDRKPDRWRRVRRELDRFRSRHGNRLTSLTRRISAIDARYMTASPDPAVLRPSYTLADQLAVEPNPLLEINEQTSSHQIAMTRQEIAVALSHIVTWRRIANGNDEAALILEDDVVMRYGFAHRLQATWTALRKPSGGADFDLLYLAYKNVAAAPHTLTGTPMRWRDPGVWEAAAYILTKSGAKTLLDQLPAFGPIDLWLNLQFKKIKTFTASRALIEQRIDEPSTNSYSVLPVLSQVGVITNEKAQLPSQQKLPGPVLGLGLGEAHTGLTSLATALSMLGYTCLSDIDDIPQRELELLRRGERRRQFNAYVNVGSLSNEMVQEIAMAYPDALFVVTTPGHGTDRLPVDRVLHLGAAITDKWESLSAFLGIDYPPFPYPAGNDIDQRNAAPHSELDSPLPARNLKFDVSPWVVSPRPLGWQGVPTRLGRTIGCAAAPIKWSAGEPLDNETWKLRDDTFPSNLALFTPGNVRASDDGLELAMRQECTSVRNFTAAAIATRKSYLYGAFSAELRPAKGPGLITGLFLHRNGPRQEIDIEFLGRDTTKMLINVFYNPGPAGTKLEFGYRGTPTEISLGFDAATDSHLYEIEWQPDIIVWKVDGVAVFERTLWNPTPIPNCPLEYNLNLWHSRSREFAGKLDQRQLPARTIVRSIAITAEER